MSVGDPTRRSIQRRERGSGGKLSAGLAEPGPGGGVAVDNQDPFVVEREFRLLLGGLVFDPGGRLRPFPRVGIEVLEVEGIGVVVVRPVESAWRLGGPYAQF